MIDPPPLPSRTPAVNFDKMKAAAGLALIMTTSIAKACDGTSFVSSENKIYMDDSYSTLYSGVYHMTASQTLCLKFEDGSVYRIVIQGTQSA